MGFQHTPFEGLPGTRYHLPPVTHRQSRYTRAELTAIAKYRNLKQNYLAYTSVISPPGAPAAAQPRLARGSPACRSLCDACLPPAPPWLLVLHCAELRRVTPHSVFVAHHIIGPVCTEFAARASADIAFPYSAPLEERDGLASFSQCRVLRRNFSALLAAAPSEEELLLLPRPADDASAAAGPCHSGWHFDYSQYATTVITEWELVCDRDYYATLALVLLGVGGLIGNYIFGYLQDSIGRRPAFFIYLFIECFFGIATAFAQDFVTWTLLRFGLGFTVPAILGTPYVLAIELVGPEKRTTMTIMSNIAYSFGLVLLSAVVYLVRDWRQLALATSVPFLSFFLYWWVLPESPRWLLARGRFEEAETILKKIARVNGKSLPANYMVQLKRRFQVEQHVQHREKQRRYGITDLVRTPNMRRKTLIITFIWFTNTSVYVGLSYYAPALGGDEFLNFFLAGVVELPTYLFLWPAMELWGRRWTLCLSMAVGGAACLATVLVQSNPSLTLGLYCVGKMGISSSYVVLPLLASELYPTVVRGIGMSTSSVFGMLGPIFIPLLNYMGEEMLVLPLMTMGALLVAGSACSLLLPETLHRGLPQTLEDGEAFGRDWSWRDFIRCCPPRVGDVSMEDKPTSLESPLRSLVLQHHQKAAAGSGAAPRASVTVIDGGAGAGDAPSSPRQLDPPGGRHCVAAGCEGGAAPASATEHAVRITVV
ncbi:beta-alanine transporter-like [Schistocerca cancellata]|uniref:beta-alanine transporter-like n=1 Tax=Schistocerca cancellata TaxID=274614 RepID=UPI0021179A1D|nr:beta-alanine transporter-like [Schistocerca cancellata]